MENRIVVTHGANSILEECDNLIYVLEHCCGTEQMPSPGDVSDALELAKNVRAGLINESILTDIAKEFIKALAYIVSQWLMSN